MSATDACSLGLLHYSLICVDRIFDSEDHPFHGEVGPRKYQIHSDILHIVAAASATASAKLTLQQ